MAGRLRMDQFRWVRGELIGKGTCGDTYLALNATTGEMIVTKQIAIPHSSRQVSGDSRPSVVEGLKLESAILQDLDHPNIVQYLGFSETPEVLSLFVIFTQYAVP